MNIDSEQQIHLIEKLLDDEGISKYQGKGMFYTVYGRVRILVARKNEKITTMRTWLFATSLIIIVLLVLLIWKG